MSTINRFLSRRDKHHASHKEKVTSSPTSTPTTTSASFSSSRHSSSSSLSSLSLAFSAIIPKRSPHLQATIETVECSSADATTLLLQPKQSDGLLNALFFPEENGDAERPEKEEEKKIKKLLQRLSRAGINTFQEADVAYVLAGAYASGDSDKAYELLMLLYNSEEGIIQSYNPNVKLLGAINRGGVTCYLDALLFAMFARLRSFEAMLYKNFDDPPRKRLATLLRLWVNTLRAGKLITTDITKQIQLQLSSCGWKEAAEVCQQDASEAFTFITETLALPLLTLKMDIFHTGKEDASDDHRFVNERLLELAVPDEPLDGHVITLEECLELFFNNKIEVKRYLDQLERRNTVSSVRSRRSTDSTKAHASHVEVAEINDISQPSSPVAPQSQPSAIPISSVRPSFQRQRAPSIIQEHFIDEKKGMLGLSPSIDEKGEEGPSTGRIRKEVLMPAWQFFSLIPWYTNNVPSNDAQVAAHFSSTRPILGICLKRYSMLPNGTAVKRKTHIDIPLEIGLPHFIQDDTLSEDVPAFGNFKLSLQSVVCHQGISTESGHYISLVRSPDPEQAGEDKWMRFDDLAIERVTYTNVETFLLQESPYLLFYQVVPIEGDPDNIADRERPVMNGERPPAYTESEGSRGSKKDSGVSGISSSPRVSFSFNEGPNSDFQRPSLDIHRPSSDSSTSEDGRRGRSSMSSERRVSTVLSDAGAHNPGNPKTGFLSASNLESNPNDGPNTLTASRRGSKTTQENSKSRPSSGPDNKRMSTSLSRLASRMSKDKLNNMSGSPSSTAGPRDTLTGPTAPPAQTKDPSTGKTGYAAALVTATETLVDRNRLKKEAREKSRAAYRDSHHLTKGKRKEGNPDRECLVM